MDKDHNGCEGGEGVPGGGDIPAFRDRIKASIEKTGHFNPIRQLICKKNTENLAER